MQQYRVNYGLLIGLVVGTLVLSVATFGLWKYQVSRNAGSLIATGEKAQQDGDLRTAVRDFGNYLSIRPGDDSVRVKLANLWLDITEQPEVLPEDWGRSINYLESVVRNMPEQKAVQKRLVDLYGRIYQFQPALDHLGQMIQKYPDDADLQVEQMEYLLRAKKFEGPDGAIAKCKVLIGYDDKTDTFDANKAVAPHEVSPYSNYAALLTSIEKNPELASRVLEQLVKENPKLPAAYLARGQYLVSIGEPGRGQRDIEKAYALAPEDADVLLAMASLADTDKKTERARDYYQQGEKAHPKDWRFYQGLAGLAMKEKKYEDALAWADKGIKAVPANEAQNLLFLKSELQFQANDIEGVRKTAEEMRKGGFRPEFIEWIEARIMLAQEKWFEASKALYNLQPKMAESGPYADMIAVQLGLAYEKSGRLDLAEDSYDVVLQHNPANDPANAGKQRVRAMRGRPVAKSQASDLDEQVAKVLQQPKGERDWTKIDPELQKLAEDRKMEGAVLDLFWAKMMLLREDYASARKYLVAGRDKDPKNIEIQRTAVLLLRADPSQGPDKALRLLDKMAEDFGDRADLRVDRVDCLIALNEKSRNSEELKQKLAMLNQPPADWPEDDKVALLSSMAGRYLSLNLRDEARTNLEQVAKLRPTALVTPMALFSLALESNDDVGMRSAQDKILKLVGSKNDSNWLYTEARRKISLYRRGDIGKEALPEIHQLTDKAVRARPNWFELQLVSAELDLIDGKEGDALKHFEKAQELGKPSGIAVLQHVRLLLNRGQYARAKELLETLPTPAREGDLGQVYAEVLLNTGHPDDAAKVIQKFAEAAPDNADRQLAMGQLLTRIAAATTISEARRKELLDRAGTALQQAVKLRPESPQTWLALLTFQVMQRDAAGSLAALQQAQLALPEDQLVAVMAKGNEIMGQWFNAENVYLTAIQAQPDNLPLAQELATFYLGQAYPLPDKTAKATPLVNRILHAGADGKLPPNDPSLMWARRAAAQMLSAGGEYQQLLKAEKFLASNSQDCVLPAEDQFRMAEILAPRPEPISKIKAKNLLEQVKENQQLGLKYDLMLGQLYFAVGDWQKCKSQMQQAVSRFPKSADARAQFVNMILQRGDKRDLTTAVRQMSELRKLAPNDVVTVQLTAELGAKTGKEAEVRRYLLTLLPKTDNPQQLDERQIPLLEFVASLLVKLGDLDDAERIYKLVVARNPNKLYALADFLGTHRDVGQCMDILAKNYQVELTEPTVRVAISVIRNRRDDVGDKYDSQVQGWLDRGLLENPDSIPLLMLQAEFNDVEKRYDDAAAVYSKLLTRSDVTGIIRAVVLNNLAFLVAIAGNQDETGIDPLNLVQQAAQILGPTSDILDTRAVVYTAQGKYDAAIEDLNYAVTANPSASKYFHLAVAHLGAGNNSQAIDAWQKAHELTKDVRSTLNRKEFELYDKTKAKIDSLSNPKLTRTAA